MKHLALIIALSLGACTTAQVTTAHQTEERAMIAADDLYIAVASFANTEEQTGQWSNAKGESVKQQAWQTLQTIRAAYAAGQTIDTSALQAIATQNGVKTP